eukprot:TRINITY_DN2564_c0_g2::TRINITY_DN2564_c0_g2_i1::g.19187::m.19187 TRINITY_DN2564_c0_g2::TRINITY_DN2564_c0_g2_i1::g.19187  ORF type:complete len:992 (-),score=380.37,sp/Q29116/TENA_PIG/29.26/1e-09,Laminin_B/PF00052.13/3e+02,Laminin_B/PF00052.13/0.057 TRINITY_DN2564_c0_g2_i1:279-3185(-)
MASKLSVFLLCLVASICVVTATVTSLTFDSSSQNVKKLFPLPINPKVADSELHLYSPDQSYAYSFLAPFDWVAGVRGKTGSMLEVSFKLTASGDGAASRAPVQGWPKIVLGCASGEIATLELQTVWSQDSTQGPLYNTAQSSYATLKYGSQYPWYATYFDGSKQLATEEEITAVINSLTYIFVEYSLPSLTSVSVSDISISQMLLLGSDYMPISTSSFPAGSTDTQGWLVIRRVDAQYNPDPFSVEYNEEGYVSVSPFANQVDASYFLIPVNDYLSLNRLFHFNLKSTGAGEAYSTVKDVLLFGGGEELYQTISAPTGEFSTYFADLSASAWKDTDDNMPCDEAHFETVMSKLYYVFVRAQFYTATDSSVALDDVVVRDVPVVTSTGKDSYTHGETVVLTGAEFFSELDSVTCIFSLDGVVISESAAIDFSGAEVLCPAPRVNSASTVSVAFRVRYAHTTADYTLSSSVTVSVVAPSCEDGFANGDEGDVDCGNGCSARCEIGQSCHIGSDCVESSCSHNVCVDPTCADGVQNGAELGVDCGFDAETGTDCGGCPGGTTCQEDQDCESEYCHDGVCSAATCDDSILNQGESDTDCGGAHCDGCVDGKACVSGSDCASGVCDGNVCHTPSCDDSMTNGDETAVDCGGSCDACTDGSHCHVADDCQSGVCTDGYCAAPTCFDGVANGDEEYTDCHGTCGKCTNEECSTSAECGSGVCKSGKCQRASCEDGVMNNGETNIDCGGSCGACPILGCMDANATAHYNPEATKDDGSCLYTFAAGADEASFTTQYVSVNVPAGAFSAPVELSVSGSPDAERTITQLGYHMVTELIQLTFPTDGFNAEAPLELHFTLSSIDTTDTSAFFFQDGQEPVEVTFETETEKEVAEITGSVSVKVTASAPGYYGLAEFTDIVETVPADEDDDNTVVVVGTVVAAILAVGAGLLMFLKSRAKKNQMGHTRLSDHDDIPLVGV